MAHADMAEGVDHPFVRYDAVGERELVADFVDGIGHASFPLNILGIVMPGLVPGMHVFDIVQDGDGRDKPGHDAFSTIIAEPEGSEATTSRRGDTECRTG